MDRLPGEVRDVVRMLYDVPYEGFSRFLLASPRMLQPEEAFASAKEGWGLTCIEKTRALAHWLSERGIQNTILPGAFELWHRGANVLQIKGDGSEPPNEEFIGQFYRDDWDTSPYETPAHFAHWANCFVIGNDRYLVDVMGHMAPLRVFCGEEVARLMDARPKAYVNHLPMGLRLYYHSISEPLLNRVMAKSDRLLTYSLGRLVATALAASDHCLVNVKWWWKERAFEADLKAVPEQTRTISGGKVEVTFHETIDEVRACVGELPRPNYWDAFSKAYPTILEWVDRVYEGPKWVRLAVTRSPKRLVDYVSTEIFVE